MELNNFKKMKTSSLHYGWCYSELASIYVLQIATFV